MQTSPFSRPQDRLRRNGSLPWRLRAVVGLIALAATHRGVSEEMPRGTALVLPWVGTTYTGNFIVDATDNPGGQNTLAPGDTITVTNGSTYVGNYHTGAFTQNGGTFNSGALTLGIGYGSSGTFNLNGGVLIASVVYGGFSTPSTSTLNLNGGTLQATSSTNFIQGLTAVYVQSGGALIDTNGLLINIQQKFLHAPPLGSTPDGGLSKLGTGTLMLSGLNTYTGPTTLAAGTLTVNELGALGNTSVLNFNGGALQYSTFDQTDYSPRFSTAAAQVYRIDTNGQNVTFSTGLTSPGGSLTKLGTGTLTLLGVGTYTGGTVFAGGTVNAPLANSLGSTGTLGFSGGTLQYGGANQTDYSGRFSTAANQAYSIDTNGQTVTFATGLTSSGGTLNKLGTGSLILTGADTYTGGTVINAGLVEFGAANALPTTGAIQVKYGATLAVPTSVYSSPALLDGVRNSSNITFNSGSTFGIDTGASTTDFMYDSPLGGVVGLTKLGTGTGALVLTGMNTYTGPTTVSAGTLTVPAGVTLTTGTGAINVGAGATFNVAGTVGSSGDVTADGTKSSAATVTLGDGANLNVKLGTLLLGVNGNTNLTQFAGANVVGNNIQLGVNAGSVGTFTQNGGTTSLVIGGSSGHGLGTLQIAVNGGSQGTYVLNAGSLSASTESIGSSGIGTFTQNGGTNTLTGTLSLGNSSTYHLNGGALQVPGISSSSSGATFNFNGGTLQANANSPAFIDKLKLVQMRGGTTSQGASYGGAVIDTAGYNITVNQALVHSTINGDSVIDGGLTKLGNGTLTLAGKNTYTGTTSVNAGALVIASTSTLGDGAVKVANNTTLTNNGTVNSAVSVSGTLAGSGMFNGPVTVQSGGALSGAAIINGVLTVDSGGVVILNGGTLTANGGVVNNGIIRLKHGAVLVTGNGATFTNNGTLDVITGGFTAPAGFINNGVVLDSSLIGVKTLARNGGTVTLILNGYNGHTYQFQSNPSLNGSGYTNIGSQLTGETGKELTFTDAAATGTQRFYRVQVDP